MQQVRQLLAVRWFDKSMKTRHQRATKARQVAAAVATGLLSRIVEHRERRECSLARADFAAGSRSFKSRSSRTNSLLDPTGQVRVRR